MMPLAVMCWLLLVLACSPTTVEPQPGRAASFDPTTLTICEDAFQIWVDSAESLNNPDADLADTLFVQEIVQRRIFELCSLDEAERYNREILWEPTPGISQPLIETDFRTFAEIECVDEAPLLDGTPLCAEVGH